METLQNIQQVLAKTQLLATIQKLKNTKAGLQAELDMVAVEKNATKAAIEYLKQKGFSRYEVSNFCREGYFSKHNLNYWQRGEYIGFGVSASSFIDNRRFTNTESIEEYVYAVLRNASPEVFSEEVVGDDAKREFAMLALRTEFGVSLLSYDLAFGSSFVEDFKHAIEKNAKYLDISDKNIKIKSEYLYVQNTILLDFIG